MSNIWNHPTVLAAEAVTHLEDALSVTKMCTFDSTSEFNTRANGWKKGDTIPFRTHGDFVVNDFASSIDIQDITNSSRSLAIEKHFDVSVELTARELVLELDDFSAQVIMPAAYRLAESVDKYVASKILSGAGLYISSDLFATASDIAQARKAAILQQLASNRFCLVDLELEATLLGQTWFNQSATRGVAGETTLSSGSMGMVMGMGFQSAITFPEAYHAAGNCVCVTNNTAGTKNIIGDVTLVVDTSTASRTLAVGDRLHVAGVRRPLIVKTAVADTTGLVAIALVDPITEIIPDNAAVTVIGSGLTYDYRGAIFDSRSLAVAFPLLDAPGDKEVGTASSNGVSCRIIKGYDLVSKKTTMSLDLLCGAFAFDPRRITLLADSR